jgi:O-antigen/teichoic acid export membrane protein
VERPVNADKAQQALVWLVVGNATLGIPAGAFADADVAAIFVFAALGAWIYSARLLRKSGWKTTPARRSRRVLRTALALVWEIFCIGLFVWAAEGDPGGIVFAVVMLAITTAGLARMKMHKTARSSGGSAATWDDDRQS